MTTFDNNYVQVRGSRVHNLKSLNVDIPRNKDLLTPAQLQHNKSLLPKYNKKGVFPLLVALSPNGVILDDYSGYSMNGEVGYHLEFMKRNK